MRRRLEAQGPVEARAAGRAAGARIEELVATRGLLRLAAYWPVRGELDLRPTLSRLLESGCVVALPRVRGADLDMVPVGSLSPAPLVSSAFGILEPSGPPLDPRSLDGVITPGLAFDFEGGRLGRGAGYYDRFFTKRAPSALRVGVGYAWQLQPTRLPLESHDVRLHALILGDGSCTLFHPELP